MGAELCPTRRLRQAARAWPGRPRSPYARAVAPGRSTSRANRAALRGLAALGALSVTVAAQASGPLGPEGSRIATSDYGVDLFQGPVLSSTRIVGLAGAYTAIAEGTEGIQYNPAAASLRPPYSTMLDDYDVTAAFTLPASVKNTDFDNDGQVGFAYDRFVWLSAGGILQHHRLGFGVLGAFQNYELGVPGGAVPLPNTNEVITAVKVRVLRADPVVSYALPGEELHFGFGLRIAALFAVAGTSAGGDPLEDERLLVNANTLGVQAGALWAPSRLPMRVGVAARSPLAHVAGDEGRIAPDAEGDRVVGNVYLPKRLDLPWEVEAGVAVQFGPRPLNLRWVDENTIPLEESEPYLRTEKGVREPPFRGARRLLKQRYAKLPRRRLLLSASTLVSGAVPNAVSVESMLSQTVKRSGQQASVTVRAAAEAEVIPLWLVVRAGSYLEPTRFESGSRRLHGTAGFDVRTLTWSVFGLYDEGTMFRVSGAVDFGRDYFGWSVGAGVLH